jgi:hypothetical protein
MWKEQYRKLQIEELMTDAKRPRIYRNPFTEHVNKSKTRPSSSLSNLHEKPVDKYIIWQSTSELGDNNVNDPVQ